MKNILDLKIYKIYNVSTGYFERTFDTLEELLEFLSRHQHSGWWGSYRAGLESMFGYCNSYLDEVNMTFNDTKHITWGSKDEENYILRTYVFLDPDNRIIDPRDYIEEIIKISKMDKPIRHYRYYRYGEKNLPEFRKGPVPGTGVRHEHRGSYFRHPKTMNEKRQAAIVEYKEFVSPKRNVRNLPDAWNDDGRCRSKSWKDQSKKRKQWM